MVPEAWHLTALVAAGALFVGAVFFVASRPGRPRAAEAAEKTPDPPPAVAPALTTVRAPEATPTPVAAWPEAEPRSRRAGPGDRATEAQMKYLESIVRKKGWTWAKAHDEAKVVLGFEKPLEDLNKQQASKLIDAWKAEGR